MTNSVELVFQIQKGSQGHKLIADVVQYAAFVVAEERHIKLEVLS